MIKLNKNDKIHLIRKSEVEYLNEIIDIFVIGLIEIFSGLVSVLSLGFLTSDLKAWYLFYFKENK